VVDDREDRVWPGGTLLRAVPWVIALHNGEEALSAGRILPLMQARAPEMFQSFVATLRPLHFLFAIAIVTIAAFVIAYGGRPAPDNARGYAILALQSTMLLNVGSHVAVAIALRGYAPGVATALLINAPFSWYLLRRAWRERWYSHRAMLWLAPLAVVIHGPLFFALFAVIRAY
jgi:hypothetical protein